MPSITGLTAAEVEARRAAGQTNQPPKSQTKTTGEIVRDNVCTYFNLVFLVLAVMLALVHSWLNMGFLGIVFWNTLIGIVQQLRAKRTIDKLTLVSAQKLRCLRDGRWCEVLSDDLVQDDVVEFGAGDQIAADAVVLDGSAQANESLITGEARAIPKECGAELKSGSFLMAGRCVARLTRVGAESYASRLTAEAQADGHRVARGEMMRSLDRLIKFIGVALIPIGAVLIWKQHWVLELSMKDTVDATVAALIGMIPEGLYLLTSVALAVSMMRLARRKVLTRDMNCIETLARVDTLCVDKTGTITESTMQADDPLPQAENTPITEILSAFYAGGQPDNDTARALTARFGQGGTAWAAVRTIPFNTAYRYSAKDFGAQGCYVVGAPDVLAGSRAGELADRLTPLLAQGRRVLLLAKYNGTLPDPPAALDPAQLEFLALLPLQNRIRESAPKTFRFFAKQGVKIKVISGDDPQAVSHVAANAGIAGAEHWVDAAALQSEAALAEAAEKCTVFGRVTPEQKRQLVHALQAKGHTVAMTGDGVNDVLALKDADCGIAMASGAQAASQVAQLVLLDSDFAALPGVVAEGRRVINNIQRSASLFLVKNIFSRIPVYDEDLDNIKGILYVKDLLPYINNGDEFGWQQLLRKAYFVPEHKKINDLLEEFQSNKVHMAVVVDEYGSTLGIVSLEDILEEIVGEISDESDAVESAYTKLDDRNYLFDGKTHIGDFERILQLPENTFADVKGEAETLAGLMLEIKRDFLKKGDVVTTHDLRFTAHTIEGRRIDKVQVTLPE